MKLHQYFVPIAAATALSFSLAAHAGENNSIAKDAWLDGKLDTIVVLNKHLNPFKIDTDVTDGIAVISGEVDSKVEKDLLTELAKGVDGIKEVDNRVQVKNPGKSLDKKALEALSNASIETAISTKLLLNTEIDSTEIDVEAKNKTVTLTGKVDSDAERDLVQQIAANTLDVKSVKNKLKVMN